MIGIENFTNSFCIKQNNLINSNDAMVHFQLYHNLEDTIIKLLEYHGKIFILIY